MSNTTDVELAVLDQDKAFAIEIKHDDKLQEGEGVYIQASLHASIFGYLLFLFSLLYASTRPSSWAPKLWYELGIIHEPHTHDEKSQGFGFAQAFLSPS